MFKAILIDDEQDALETLETDLKKYCSADVEVIGKYDSPVQGMIAIRRDNPDLVFLDIRMPDLNGFELLEILQDIDFYIIFVSGFNEYAIRAFRVSAIDFLLKPVDKNELISAIDKVKEREGLAQQQEFKVLMDNLSQIQTIAIKNQREYSFYDLADIMYCQADGNFSFIYTAKQKERQHTSYSLSKMGELLPEQQFFRIHASYFINRNHLQKYVKGDRGYVVMRDGVQIPVARSRRDDFDHWLGFDDD